MTPNSQPLAIVTGASAGIGYELAKRCAEEGFDLIIAADQTAIQTAANDFRALGAKVDAIEADLATPQGNDQVLAAANGRKVVALLANAGHGLGHGFLEQKFNAIRHVIDTNIIGRDGNGVLRAGRNGGHQGRCR